MTKKKPGPSNKISPAQSRSVPRAYSEALNESHPVRTTFNFYPEGRESLDGLAQYHGVKQKVVLDKLCTQLVTEKLIQQYSEGRWTVGIPLLKNIAKMAQSKDEKTPKDSVRKTQVISKGSLRALNEISKEYDVPRDAVVNWSLTFLYRNLIEEIEMMEKGNDKALEIIDKLDLYATDTGRKLEKTLDVANPILSRFQIISQAISDLREAIQANLEKRTPIDPDDLHQFD
jgi:hypothetical protein